MRDPVQIASQLNRRHLLRIGGCGMLGLTLPRLLQASDESTEMRTVARARRVIFLFQWGGPSHVDTFDMKHGVADQFRSKYQAMSTAVPGMSICEHLPDTAGVMHEIAQIRTVHHTMNNHNSAGYTALTGMEPPTDDQRLAGAVPGLWFCGGSCWLVFRRIAGICLVPVPDCRRVHHAGADCQLSGSVVRSFVYTECPQ